MRISSLVTWRLQTVLDVLLAELEESDLPLSRPVMERRKWFES